MIIYVMVCSLFLTYTAAADEKSRECYSCIGDTDGDSNELLCVNPTPSTSKSNLVNNGCYTKITESELGTRRTVERRPYLTANNMTSDTCVLIDARTKQCFCFTDACNANIWPPLVKPSSLVKPPNSDASTPTSSSIPSYICYGVCLEKNSTMCNYTDSCRGSCKAQYFASSGELLRACGERSYTAESCSTTKVPE